MRRVTHRTTGLQRDSRRRRSSGVEANRPPPRNDRPQGSYHPQGPRPYDNRRDTRPQAPPPNVQERLRNMSPQDRQRLAQNEQRLRSLSPAQQQELRDRARVWQKMTPEAAGAHPQ